MKYSLKSLTLIAISTAFISACTNTKVANSDNLENEAAKQASSAEISLEDAINSASKKYAKAIDDGLRFYAPLHIEKAADKLDDAQQMAKKITSPEKKVEAMSMAFSVNKLIDKAYKNKEVVTEQLSKTLAHKEVLQEIEADRIHPKSYQKAMTKLNKLIKEIEGGFITKAKEDEVSVLEYYAELEAKTLKTTYLTKAINKLDEAESIDADNYAEVTYEKAEAAVKYADSFIDNNYRDRQGVLDVTEKAYNKAAHAFYIGEEAARLEKIDKDEAEQYILRIESFLQRINQQAGVKNLTSMSLHDQSVALTQAFESMKNGYRVATTQATTASPNVQIEKDASTKPVKKSKAETTKAETAVVETAETETAEVEATGAETAEAKTAETETAKVQTTEAMENSQVTETESSASVNQ